MMQRQMTDSYKGIHGTIQKYTPQFIMIRLSMWLLICVVNISWSYYSQSTSRDTEPGVVGFELLGGCISSLWFMLASWSSFADCFLSEHIPRNLRRCWLHRLMHIMPHYIQQKGTRCQRVLAMILAVWLAGADAAAFISSIQPTR